jgi:hypothetical protein
VGSLSSVKTTTSSWNVKYGRLLFVLVLVAAAAALGFGGYRLMEKAQMQIASDRFDSIADRALVVAQYVMEEKKKTADALAMMIANTHPNSSSYPMVALTGYTDIASNLRLVTDGSLSFCPIVIPGGEEQALFEEFAYKLFEQEGFPNGTGESDFGRGIFSFGDGQYGNETYEDGRFHTTSGWTYHNSSRSILVPLLQSDQGEHPELMLNVHFEHREAAIMDNILQCSEEREKAGDYRECGGLSEMMRTSTAELDVDVGPASLMMVPIYPREDNTTVRYNTI